MADDATRTRSRGLVLKPNTRVPALTILWHSQSRRVGERALLADLGFGGQAQVSRDTPLFGPAYAAPSEPLSEPSVSRSAPLQMRAVEAGIALQCARAGKVWVNGQPLQSELVLPDSALDRGVVICLSYGVALILHRLTAMPAPPGPPERMGMVGESEAVRHVRQQIAKVAPHDVGVLVLGESGTGKELAARALHEQSPRRRGPFVAVNLAEIPPNLAASALFGHAAGAFTGADKNQPGHFGMADGGTLFLDEIGQAPLEIQAALLRALETGEVQPVRASKPQRVDVRVVAATDANLEQAAADGRFQAPLLFRLRSYEIRLPPLRERREDVGLILRHFLELDLRRLGRAELLECAADREPWLPANLVAELADQDFPGNVRELRSAAQRLVIDWGQEAQVGLQSWPGHGRPSLPSAGGLGAASARGAEPAAPERAPGELSAGELVEALEREKWGVERAAQALGMSRTTLYKLMREHGLSIASELTAEQIRPRLLEHPGNMAQAAQALHVSEKALLARLRVLADKGLDELASRPKRR